VAEGRRAATAPRRACDGLLAKGWIDRRQYRICTSKRGNLDSIAATCNCAVGAIVHQAERSVIGGETFLTRGNDVILCNITERGYNPVFYGSRSLLYRKATFVETSCAILL
jgi:hypothetical protein